MSETQVKFLLGEQDIPTHWVNLMADLPGDAPPPLHPGTKEPAGPDDLTPIFPMGLILQEVSAGHDFVPPPVHAGGLRCHGDSPLVCGLVKAGLVEPRAYRQNATFEAAVRFARAEGIIPAPEPAHAIRAVIDEAEAARDAGEARVILFGLCGHGHFDLSAYDAFLAGKLEDPEFSEDDMEAALAGLPEAPALT
jgi:tryptophan synthase beta chain